MEQSPSWEANLFSASQEIPCILWNLKIQSRIHKYLPPVPILSQLDPVRHNIMQHLANDLRRMGYAQRPCTKNCLFNTNGNHLILVVPVMFCQACLLNNIQQVDQQMQLVIDFYFLSICVWLYMFRASSAHHRESLTVHTASSFCVCVCLRHCLVRNMKMHGPGNIKHSTSPQYYLGVSRNAR
jgi:hypothetical protein